jgi:hypothetical protein
VEWKWQGKTEVLGKKPVPVPLCPPQIPHGLTWASAVRGRRLTAWATARSLPQQLLKNHFLSRKVKKPTSHFYICPFLGAFAKLRKATISFVTSVYPSVSMEQLGSHWKGFHKNWYVSIFWKSVEKMQVSLQSDNNNGTLHADLRTFMIYFFMEFFLEWENFQTKPVDKIKTHILCSITFFRRSCRLWDNVGKCGRARQATDDNIIRRMRFACWTTKATDTHFEYVILLFHGNIGYANAPQWYVYTHIACPVLWSIIVTPTSQHICSKYSLSTKF